MRLPYDNCVVGPYPRLLFGGGDFLGAGMDDRYVGRDDFLPGLRRRDVLTLFPATPREFALRRPDLAMPDVDTIRGRIICVRVQGLESSLPACLGRRALARRQWHEGDPFLGLSLGWLGLVVGLPS